MPSRALLHSENQAHLHISSRTAKELRHQNHHQLLKFPKYLLPLQAATGQAAASCEHGEVPSKREHPGTHRLWMGGRPACFTLVARCPAEMLAPTVPQSQVPPCPLSQVPLQPPTPQRVLTTHGVGNTKLPTGSQERMGSAIKTPRFPLFPLPQQLLPRSAGWGSGICHGKLRAGNKLPNCRMLTDTHVTSVRGVGSRRFPPGPSKPVPSLLPPRDRGCKATTPRP